MKFFLAQHLRQRLDGQERIVTAAHLRHRVAQSGIDDRLIADPGGVGPSAKVRDQVGVKPGDGLGLARRRNLSAPLGCQVSTGRHLALGRFQRTRDIR